MLKSSRESGVGFELTGAEGASVRTVSVRVLIVDDYEPWRHFVLTVLRNQPEMQIVGVVSDGLEAVQVACKLRPDLILLDIGLPTLNGIEAARRIRKLSPKSKILFVSENRSWDVTEEALSSGAIGYVVKSNAREELLPALKAAFEGERFVSPSIDCRNPADASNDRISKHSQFQKIAAPIPVEGHVGPRSHHVVFWSDGQVLRDEVPHFVGSGLNAGSAAIVVATETHRESLLSGLQAYGVDPHAVLSKADILP